MINRLGLDRPAESERTGRMCLEWTERIYHIGPPLGTFLLTQMRAKNWIESGDVPRKLVITVRGKAQFAELGIDVT